MRQAHGHAPKRDQRRVFEYAVLTKDAKSLEERVESGAETKRQESIDIAFVTRHESVTYIVIHDCINSQAQTAIGANRPSISLRLVLPPAPRAISILGVAKTSFGRLAHQ